MVLCSILGAYDRYQLSTYIRVVWGSQHSLVAATQFVCVFLFIYFLLLEEEVCVFNLFVVVVVGGRGLKVNYLTSPIFHIPSSYKFTICQYIMYFSPSFRNKSLYQYHMY